MGRSDWTWRGLVMGPRMSIVVEDLNLGRMTVTNDIEAVVEDLARQGLLRDGDLLHYIDSEDRLDRVFHARGRFLRFGAAIVDREGRPLVWSA